MIYSTDLWLKVAIPKNFNRFESKQMSVALIGFNLKIGLEFRNYTLNCAITQ